MSLRKTGVLFGSRTPALDGVELDLSPGSHTAFVGPSGAGKTTLLRLCGALVEPTAGSVTWDGASLGERSTAERRALRSRIGFVHQDFRLVPQLRVIQNVVAGRLGRFSFLRTLRQLAFPLRETAAEVHELLERLGLEEKLYERTDRLSGGQRQRVAVARALFQEPGLLLADEPVASVDPARARGLLELLVGEARNSGATLAVSLHDPDLARRYFPRLVGLRRGEIVFDLPSSEVDAARLEHLYAVEAR